MLSLVIIIGLSLLALGGYAAPFSEVDATSLRGKIMCGYQGWFRCQGDGSDLGWTHWSHNWKKFDPSFARCEYWPDMTEYSAAERFAAPGYTYPDGKPAELF